MIQPAQTGSSTPRVRCAECVRPKRACICQWVTPVAHAVEVLILQHPLEVRHAKGSARLLHLSLPGSRVIAGEVFDTQSLLAGPKTNLLLYPRSSHLDSPSPPIAHALCEPTDLRLIVLDATWRKSRKMLHLNPPLQHLPRLSLHDVPVSQYLIRKAHSPDQLSTFEATCAALAQLEGDAGRFQPLLRAFEGFVAQQLSWQANGSITQINHRR